MKSNNLLAAFGGEPVLPEPLTYPRSCGLEGAFLEHATEGPTWSGYAGTDLPVRSALERIAAALQGYDHAVAFSSGTDAIAAMFRAALTIRGRKWCEGRTKVLTAAATFVPGTLGGVYDAVLHSLGFEPEWVVFDTRGGADPTVDEVALVEYLRAHADQVLGVIVPSLLGTWARLDPIIAACEEEGGIPMFSDEAQALGARRPGERKPTAAAGSGQGGKGGANGGEIGVGFADDPLMAYLARRYTDAGNEPAGALNPLGHKPEIELLGKAMNRRAPAHTSALALAQLIQSVERQAEIAQVRAEIREVLAAHPGLFEAPPLKPAAQHRPYSEPVYGDLLLAAPGFLPPGAWIEILRAHGVGAPGTPYARYATRRFYPLAGEHPDWPKVTRVGAMANARRIAADGVILHVGALVPGMADWLDQIISETEERRSSVRAALGIL